MQIRVQILKDLEFRLGPDGNGGALEALRKQVHKISFAVVNCASGHSGELAMWKAMWQIRPGVRCLGYEYQNFHLDYTSHFFTSLSLTFFICKWDIIIL